MLQQTRVDTVIPYYERFLERFPDIEALAAADEEDVLREWAGLGYYARARNLRRAAALVVRDHGGRLPRDPAALAALPGIGRYTVGAIRSIAFREPAAIVDGNVRRVLSRLLAEPSLDEPTLWEVAGRLVPEERPDEFNQALMELGATLCLPRRPACPECPLRVECLAAEQGTPEAYPRPTRRAAPKRLRILAGVLERSGGRPGLLLLRRPSRGLLGGLWELPTVESDLEDELVAAVHERSGLRTRIQATLGTLRHELTHRSLRLRVVRLERIGGRLRSSTPGRFHRRDEVAALALSRLMTRALRIAGHKV